jgi:hypothetical protein
MYRGDGNRSNGLAEQLGMLGTVPFMGRVLALLSYDPAVCTAVACLPDLFVAAVGTVDRMALVIALLRAEHFAIPVIDHYAVIEVDVVRIAISGCVASSTFSLTVAVGAADVVCVSHIVSLTQFICEVGIVRGSRHSF